MNAELDYDLTPHQWETLRALRMPASARRTLNRRTLDELVALELAAISDGFPQLTPTGRKVLIRGSSKLLDLAA
jgi:hypothetical protein